jgi:hypothetical protein
MLLAWVNDVKLQGDQKTLLNLDHVTRMYRDTSYTTSYTTIHFVNGEVVNVSEDIHAIVQSAKPAWRP